MEEESNTFDDFTDFVVEHKKAIIAGTIVLILIIVIVVVLNTDYSHKRLYNNTQLFNDEKQELIGFDKLKPSEDAIRYTLSTFIRLNNLDGNTVWVENQGYKKYILDNSGSPNIVYHREKGQVDVEIAYKSDEGVNEMYSFELPYFPQQRWVQLCVVVNGKTVQLFMDGVLHTATKLDTAPWKAQNMLVLGRYNKNFNGYLGLVDYYNRALSIDEVKKLYNRRKRSLPSKVYTYEETKYLESKYDIKGKVNKIKKF